MVGQRQAKRLAISPVYRGPLADRPGPQHDAERTYVEAALSRGLVSLLFGVSPLDPATYAVVTAVLVLVAGLSAYLPSRGAANVDPLVTLRDE